MDLFEKCDQYTIAREAEEGGYYPYFIPLSGSEGTQATYQGRPLIMCGSNNYLGLTTHPKVRQASAQAIQDFGTSCTGSRFLNGTLEMHEELERRLAQFVGKESALVFSTGMQTNLGVISALIGRNDVVILDKEDHASIVDGARLSYGETRRYRHNDMEDLDRVLSSVSDEKGKMVVVDGLFSMGGDLADLPGIVKLCRQHGARVMVDDAHAVGILGEGRGTAAHFGLTDEVDLIMSTFSKSFASIGGFVAGGDQVVHYIKHHARSLIFSASLPPSNTAAVLAALDVMESEPERIRRVNELGDRMRSRFKALGFDTGPWVTPIIPIIVGDTMRTIGMWKGLFDAGVFVNPVLSPAVPEGQELLRTSYMATHTDEQLDQVVAAFETVGRNLGMI